MSIVNLNDLLPPAPSGSLNVKWQWQLYPTGTNRYISAYVPEFIDSIQQERFTWAVDVGVADAYAVVLDPPPTIVPGSAVVFQVLNANTGPSTLSVNGTIYPILKQGTFPLSAGDLFPGQIVVTVQDTLGNFQLVCEDQTRGSTGIVQLASSTGDYTPGNLASYGLRGDLEDSGVQPQTSGGVGSPIREVPLGVRNLSNVDFQLSYIPEDDWVVLHVNGDEQNPFRLYYLTPGTPNFTMTHPPKASDDFVAYYLRGIPNLGPPPPGVPPPLPPPVPLPPGSISGCSGGVATYINGPGPGPHRWWRVDVTENEVPGGWTPGNNAYAISCAELGLRSALGGSSAAVGGTAIESSEFPGQPAALAFDGDPATFWDSAGPIFGVFNLGWLGYEFASKISIIEFAWTSRSSFAAFQVPTKCTLDWSDDGAHWTQGWGFTVPTSCWVNVGANGTLVFTTGGGIAPPPQSTASTLTIWASYASGAPTGAPAVGYTEDAGLTWVGGDSTLPTDVGATAPFPTAPFAKQAVPVSISPQPDPSKFKVRIWVAGAGPAASVDDVLSIFDVQLDLNSTEYGSPQASRTMGPESGMQFARFGAGNTICQFGDYVAAPGSVFALWCPGNTMAGIDIFLISWASGAFAALSANWIPQSMRDRYGVRRGGQLVTRSGGSLYLMNVGDPGYRNFLFNDFFPGYLAANGPNFRHGIPSDAAHPTLVTIDAWYSDYGTWGATPWDTGYAQTEAEWHADIAGFFAAAKEQCPAIWLAPHLSSVTDVSLAAFQGLFTDCPCIMVEPYQISDLADPGQGLKRVQVSAQLTNLHWFANLAAPVFANGPPTRIVLFGLWVDNHDYHSALGLYSIMRGPNTDFDLLYTNPQAPVDPGIWLPTANKLGSAQGGPTVLSGSGGTAFFQRVYQGGIGFFNLDTVAHTASLPAGATDWALNPLGSSITIGPGKGDVVLVGTPVAVGVRPTRVAVIPGPDGTVSAPALAIDVDASPPTTAAAIARPNFSTTTVGSVLELSGFGG